MREINVKLSTKGQVTLPMEVRKKLSVGPGDTVLWIYNEDGIFLERAPDDPDGEPSAAKPRPTKPRPVKPRSARSSKTTAPRASRRPAREG